MEPKPRLPVSGMCFASFQLGDGTQGNRVGPRATDTRNAINLADTIGCLSSLRLQTPAQNRPRPPRGLLERSCYLAVVALVGRGFLAAEEGAHPLPKRGSGPVGRGDAWLVRRRGGGHRLALRPVGGRGRNPPELAAHAGILLALPLVLAT